MFCSSDTIHKPPNTSITLLAGERRLTTATQTHLQPEVRTMPCVLHTSHTWDGYSNLATSKLERRDLGDGDTGGIIAIIVVVVVAVIAVGVIWSCVKQVHAKAYAKTGHTAHEVRRRNHGCQSLRSHRPPPRLRDLERDGGSAYDIPQHSMPQCPPPSYQSRPAGGSLGPKSLQAPQSSFGPKQTLCHMPSMAPQLSLGRSQSLGPQSFRGAKSSRGPTKSSLGPPLSFAPMSSHGTTSSHGRKTSLGPNSGRVGETGRTHRSQSVSNHHENTRHVSSRTYLESLRRGAPTPSAYFEGT